MMLDRFEREKSLEFLRKGFEEAGRRVDEGVLERAVEELDGIPGWLTFFGNSYLSGKPDLPSIKRKAVGLAMEELKHLLKGRPKRYGLVLKAVAEGKGGWSEVKRYVEEREGCTLSTSVLHNILENLEKMSILKDYTFLDPVYREAAKLLYPKLV